MQWFICVYIYNIQIFHQCVYFHILSVSFNTHILPYTLILQREAVFAAQRCERVQPGVTTNLNTGRRRACWLSPDLRTPPSAVFTRWVVWREGGGAHRGKEVSCQRGEEQGGVNQRRAPDSGDLTSSFWPRSLTATEQCGKMSGHASTLPASTFPCLSSLSACYTFGGL